jgi:hypothetical protein
VHYLCFGILTLIENQSLKPKKTTITKTIMCIISPLLQLPQKNRSLEAQEHNTFAQEKKKKHIISPFGRL